MKLIFIFLLVLPVLIVAARLDMEKIFHNGNNQFTARMFSEVLKKNNKKSIILSASSVITPLAQLALATEGPSHDELIDVLGFLDDDTTNAIFSLINVRDKSTEGVQVKKANKLYVAQGYFIQSSFANVSKYVYNSEIANVDFTDNINAAKEINTWVEDHTNHRIKDIIDPNSIKNKTRVVLVNSLYFKGPWKYPFVRDATRKEDFYVTKNEIIQIPIMYNSDKYAYTQSKILKSKILALPYKGEQAHLLIVLPDDIEGIGELLEKLKNPNILDRETHEMFYIKVDVSLPKFKIETTTNLREILEEMNVTKIFGREANLNKLIQTTTEENLYVTDAVQKAFIEINEDGTEAAAANVFAIAELTSVEDRRDFNANHPFVFFLMMHGDILFNGVFYRL